MNTFKNLITAFVAVISVLSMAGSGAYAATLNIRADGQLLGATGVTVGNSEFDVEFVEGTCISLFGGCDEASDFTFNTQFDAELASQALLDQVFLDILNSHQFDSDVNKTFGINNNLALGNTWTPYRYNIGADQVEMSRATNNNDEAKDSVGTNPFFDRNFDSIGNGFIVYARWTTPQVSAIPLPAALPLYGAGLVVMGFMGWRNKRKS